MNALPIIKQLIDESIITPKLATYFSIIPHRLVSLKPLLLILALLFLMGANQPLLAAADTNYVINTNGGQCSLYGTNGGLAVYVGPTGQFQVKRCDVDTTTSSVGQYYYSDDLPTVVGLFNGLYLAIGNTIIGPYEDAGGNAAYRGDQAWTSVSGSGGSTLGDGTTEHVMTAVVDGLTYTLTQTVSYIFPRDYYSVSINLDVPAGNTHNLKLYSWTDLMLNGNDKGYCDRVTRYPEYLSGRDATGSVVAGYQQNSTTNHWDHYFCGLYVTPFNDLKAALDLSDTFNTAETDIGAAVQWSIGTVADTTFTADYDFVFSNNIPTLTKRYGPDDGDTNHTITTGQTTQLSLIVTNTSPKPAQRYIDFTETLPANVSLVGAPVASQCGGTVLVGTSGGRDTVTLADGELATGAATCEVVVDVTSTTSGVYDDPSENVMATRHVQNKTQAELTVLNPGAAFPEGSGLSDSVCSATTPAGAYDSIGLRWEHNGGSGTDPDPTIDNTSIFASATAATFMGITASINNYDLNVDADTIPAAYDPAKYIEYTFTTANFGSTLAEVFGVGLAHYNKGDAADNQRTGTYRFAIAIDDNAAFGSPEVLISDIQLDDGDVSNADVATTPSDLGSSIHTLGHYNASGQSIQLAASTTYTMRVYPYAVTASGEDGVQLYTNTVLWDDFMPKVATCAPKDHADAPTSGTSPNGTGTNAYGDAPHLITGGIQLGATITSEPNAVADADNASDDGITIPTLKQGQSAMITATVSGAGGYLQGWIDWNGNGTFENSDRVAENKQLASGTSGTIDLLVFPPHDAVTTPTTARFRWSTEQDLDATSEAPDGEVEDYTVTVLPSLTLPPQEVCSDISHPLLRPKFTSPTNEAPILLGNTIRFPNIATLDGQSIDMVSEVIGLDGLGEVTYFKALSGGTVKLQIESTSRQGLGTVVEAVVKHKFVKSGTLTPMPITAEFTINDIDLDDESRLESLTIHRNEVSDYSLHPDTKLEVTYDGDNLTFMGTIDVDVNAGSVTPKVAIKFLIEDRSDFTVVHRAQEVHPTNTKGINKVGFEYDMFDLGPLPACTQTEYSDAPADGVPAPNTTDTTAYGVAEHTVNHVFHLGDEMTAEGSSAADTDNASDDGITFPTLTQDTAATITATVNGADGYLQGWVDWNGDGDFADAGEKIVTDLQLATPSDASGTISIPVTPPADAITDQTYARFRWSTDMGLDSTTAASDGEVEDYAVTVAEPAGTPFTCDGTLYQIFTTNSVSTLHKVEFTNGGASFTPIGTGAAGNFNGAYGYNEQDGYIYGLAFNGNGAARHLYRVGADGAFVDLGEVPLLPSSSDVNKPFQYNIGTILPNGKLFFTYKGSSDYYTIDLTTNPLVFSKMTAIGKISKGGDWAYNPSDGYVYSIHQGDDQIIKIDPTNGEGVLVTTTQQFKSQYGAHWFDNAGNYYVYESLDGAFLRIDLQTGVSTQIATSVSTSEQDGASCRGAPVPLMKDYSDAPADGATAPDGTSVASYGVAIHTDINTLNKLGATITDETSAVFDADNTSDDGITFPTLTQGTAATITATVNGAGGYLQGWIDWNGDGDFADAGEQIVTDLQLATPSDASGTISIPVTPPADAITNQTYARFRWSTDMGLDSTTAANDGEVEDYAVTVIAPAGIPFSCDGTLYQIFTTNSVSTLHKVEFTNGGASFTPIGTGAAGNFNGAYGYNEQDGYIYGLAFNGNGAARHLYRVGADGAFVDLGEVPLLPSSGDVNAPFQYNIGTILPNGKLFFTYKGSSDYYTIDLTTNPLVFSKMTAIGKISKGGDWAYNPSDGYVYSIHQGDDQIIKIDPTNGEGVLVTTTQQFKSQYGAHWFDNAGNYYVYESLDGAFLRIDLQTGVSTQIATSVSTSEQDGASCRGAPVPLMKDYSDAPADGATAPDGTSVASYGVAIHTDINTLNKLGATITDETSAVFDADNTSDDGITFPTLTQGTAATITATVNGAGGYLQGWIDWNGDGDFADAGEQIATDLQLATPSDASGTISIPVTPPADATSNQTYARFRWSTTDGLDSTTAASNGEVEDYALTITPLILYPFPPKTGMPACNTDPANSFDGPYQVGWFHNTPSGTLNADGHWADPTDGGLGLTYGSFGPGVASAAPLTVGAGLTYTSVTNRYQVGGITEALASAAYSVSDFLTYQFTTAAGLPEGTFLDRIGYGTETDITSGDFPYRITVLVSNSSTFTEAAEIVSGHQLTGSASYSFRSLESAKRIYLSPSTTYYVRIVFHDKTATNTTVSWDDFQIGFGECFDHGDAPLAGYGDPTHTITATATLQLGATAPDAEPASEQSTDAGVGADGDEGAFTADEDGITIPTLVRSTATKVTATVIGSNGYLQGWIDWNGDGDFADAGEQIATDLQLVVPTDVSGSISIPVTPPADATSNQTYARFRWSTTAGLGSTTPASDGEVEDYAISITSDPTVVTPTTGPNTCSINHKIEWAPVTASAGSNAASFLHPRGGTVGVNLSESYTSNGTEVGPVTQGSGYPKQYTVTNTDLVNIPNYTSLGDQYSLAHWTGNSTVGDIEQTISLDFNSISGGAGSGTVLGIGGIYPDYPGRYDDSRVIVTAIKADGTTETDYSGWGFAQDASQNIEFNGGKFINPWAIGGSSSNGFTLLAGEIANTNTSYGGINDSTAAFITLPDNANYKSISITRAVTATGNTYKNRFGATKVARDSEMSYLFLGVTAPDYGDAPDSYKTTKASAGARHDLVCSNELYLGSNKADPDDGTLTNATANADDSSDTDGTADGTDDEDGVTIPTLTQGTEATITATVNGTGGYLQGWIDWNGDGDFDDADEQVVTDLQDGGTGDTDVAAGTIAFKVTPPATATTSQTYARFRWSTTAGLNSTTTANDGEVEDYAVIVEAAIKTVSGQVYIDANNSGTKDANEVGLRDTVVILRNKTTGICQSVSTLSNGSYTFSDLENGDYEMYQAHDETTPVPQSCDSALAQNPVGYQSTTADLLDITVANADVVNQDFGEVADTYNTDANDIIRFEPNHQSEILPGHTTFYAHTLGSDVDSSVRMLATGSANVTDGWIHTLYRDANCDGELNGIEGNTPINGINLGMSAGSRLCIINKVYAPATAAAQDHYAVDIAATFTFPAAVHGATPPPEVLTVTDLSITSESHVPGEQGGANLLLTKTVENLSQLTGETDTFNEALPGDVLKYRIYYHNDGTGAINDLSINDMVPEFTVLNPSTATCDGVPVGAGGLSSCSAVVNGDALEWQFSGILLGGEYGFVSYDVTIE